MKGWLKHAVKATITAFGKDLTSKTFATYFFQFHFFSFTVKTEFPSKIALHIFSVCRTTNFKFAFFLFFQVSNETFRHSRMDYLSVRFPHLAANILNELENQSLLKCKEASRQLDQIVETERLIDLKENDG